MVSSNYLQSFFPDHLNSLNDEMEWNGCTNTSRSVVKQRKRIAPLPSIKSANTMNLTLQLEKKIDYNTSCKVTQHIIPPPPGKKKKQKQSTPKILQQKTSPLNLPLVATDKKKQHQKKTCKTCHLMNPGC